ncbi:MAG: hypothetical protein N4A61_12605 [Pelagimonas sp.]|jgi:hypothetical protein|nr:hypothetical protein [Pelagimonas sp.]
MARNLKVSLPITAGRDSRILLAGALNHLDHIHNFFAYAVNWSTQVDAIAGFEIAKRFGIRFRYIGIHPRRLKTLPDIGDIETVGAQKTLASGHSSNGISDNSLLAAGVTPMADVLLRGGVAEMARVHVWRRRDFSKPIDTARGITALKVSSDLNPDLYHAYGARFEHWRSGLPSQSADRRALDFLHLELWLPAVPHVNFYVFDKDFFVNPYNDRAIIRETITAPPKYARTAGWWTT